MRFIQRFLFVSAFVMLPTLPSAAQDWLSLPDKDFVTRYGNLATGSQAQQSQFAWMLFGRVNQQVVFSGDQKKYSQWELWPSDLDTFSPNAPAFVAANKIRLVPHLQVSQLALALPKARALAGPLPANEEVTRNQLAHDYIRGHGLNTLAGISKYFATPGNEVDFPVGSIEIKAAWRRSLLSDAYQVAGYSLTALHIVIKVSPRPRDAFRDNAPSWFWTTFELKSNDGLAAAQRFNTYGDALPPDQVATLLRQAGLGGTALVNYVSNGQQMQFFDATHQGIVLGNTKIEGFLAEPGGPPEQWTSWPSSCHSCHAQASARRVGDTVELLDFSTPVGALTGSDLPPAGYQSLDFVWAFRRAH
jgi:hypothetical protein